MTAPYKKRAKAGWNRDKAQSNRDERQYEAKDVEDHMAEETRRGPAKKKLSYKEREVKAMISDIRWALKIARGKGLESLKQSGTEPDSWMRSYYQRYYQLAMRAIPKLKVVANDADLPSKVRRQIAEILEKAEVDEVK